MVQNTCLFGQVHVLLFVLPEHPPPQFASVPPTLRHFCHFTPCSPIFTHFSRVWDDGKTFPCTFPLDIYPLAGEIATSQELPGIRGGRMPALDSHHHHVQQAGPQVPITHTLTSLTSLTSHASEPKRKQALVAHFHRPGHRWKAKPTDGHHGNCIPETHSQWAP